MSNSGKTKISHPFLKTMPPEHWEHLLKNAREMDFQSGEILFREGEPANRLYLIESGRVAVQAGAHGRPVQTIGPGEVLGWSWLFPPFSWHFSAQALEPTKCVILDGAHLLVTAEENSKFGYDLMRRISQILVSRLQATRQKMLEGASTPHRQTVDK
jgi:CRP/FNR family transcriptional regulator, cyclic AMP receptor protein